MITSSSSLSEEDIPLQKRIRLKAKAKNKVKKADKVLRKQTPIPVVSQKFVIPRKKKTRGILNNSHTNSNIITINAAVCIKLKLWT